MEKRIDDDVEPTICVECGREFYPKGKQATICSRACAGVIGSRNRDYRKTKPHRLHTRSTRVPQAA